MTKPAKQQKFTAVPGCKCGSCQQIQQTERLGQPAKLLPELASPRKPDLYFGKAAN
jgi:hypothetical protein